MNNRKMRLISGIVCTMLIVVMFVSLFYIVKEENHQCTGEDCPVCACIHQAEQILRNLGTGLVVAVCVSFTVTGGMPVVSGYCSTVRCSSLVAQKVRMND
mgnify:FL=1